MDNITKSQIVEVLQKEYLRRILTQYFMEKGFDNFMVKPYPPVFLDLLDRLPMLDGLIEVESYLNDINVKTNDLNIGWNIFVLGSKRIFIGYTNHASMSEIQSNLNAVDIIHDGPHTIKDIIEAIVEFLGSSKKIKNIHKNAGSSDLTKPGMHPLSYGPIPDIRRKV